MIVSVPQLLARAKRQQTALLCCSVSTVEALQPCLQAAEAHHQSIILGGALTEVGAYQRLEMLLATAYWLANRSTVAVGIEVDVRALSNHHLESLLPGLSAFSALHISYRLTKTPLVLASTMTSGGVLAAVQDLDSISQVISVHDVQAVRVPASCSLQYIHELSKVVKVPIILDEAEFSPVQLRQMVQAGVSGISLEQQVHESFTAGLRTALRHRELHDPAVYLQQAQTAVRHRVANYLAYLSK